MSIEAGKGLLCDLSISEQVKPWLLRLIDAVDQVSEAIEAFMELDYISTDRFHQNPYAKLDLNRNWPQTPRSPYQMLGYDQGGRDEERLATTADQQTVRTK